MSDASEKFGGYTHDELHKAWEERISPSLRGAHWKAPIDCPVVLRDGETREGLEDLFSTASQFFTTQPVWVDHDPETNTYHAWGPGYWNGPEGLQ